MFFLPKRLNSRSRTVQFLGVALAVFMGAQPLMAAMPMTEKEQREFYRFAKQLAIQQANERARRSFATKAVGQLPCMQDKKPIMGSNEWQELQVNSFIKAIDNTRTAFGHVVLYKTIQPTTDIKLIEMRRKQVQTLIDDPDLFNAIGNELECVRKAQDALLAYWDEAQRENPAALFYRVQSFYSSILAHRWLLGNGVNDSKRYLETTSLFSAGKVGLELLFYLGLRGVLEEGGKYFAFGIPNSVRTDGRKLFSPSKAFWRGLKKPYISLYPFPTELGRNYNPTKATLFDMQEIFSHGSLDDQFLAARGQCNVISEVELGMFGSGIRWATTIPHIPNMSEDCCCLGWLAHKVNTFKPCESFRDYLARKKWVTSNNTAVFEKTADLGGGSPWVRGWNNLVALIGVSSYAAYNVVNIYEMVKYTLGKAKHQIVTMKELHVHTTHLARAMDAMHKLTDMVCNHEVLRRTCTAEHMHGVVGHPSADLQKLSKLLKARTFNGESAQSHLYSRGNVLLAHRMFGKVKDELVSLLQAVGELDAVYSMALAMKEHQNSAKPFTLVEFIPDVQATIHLEAAWLPMVKQPVANTITLGGGTHHNKMIITGPNGGGKSVFLKTLGCCVLLAQSWGIVPAKRARMSLFDGVRSCIHPQESIEHELSTFMAEKLRIDAIRQYIFQNNRPGFKSLLLLDEPFKGTVDAESADRIYEFGKEIASCKGLAVSVATHVEKPVHLATDTDAYANYHVCIKELTDGTFERQFTIEPGVLRWWFDDPAKRSRFIDFVTMQKHQEQLAKAA